ncbi:hypothetical protein MMC19_002893 [Ptychographa xylographoides]|nr:hypothetical protein [Ptychographa xylographoides]
MSVAHTLMSRGLEVGRDLHAKYQMKENGDIHLGDVNMPKWGIALLGFTILLYILVSMSIRYTYAELIGTLAMIETPTVTAIVRTSPEDPDFPLPSVAEKEPLMEQELLLLKSKPITSKFRTTIKHLRAHGGFFSRFRGAHVLAMYYVIYHLLTSVLTSFAPNSSSYHSIVTIATSTILCRLNATWTHVVISEPSTKRFYQRIPARAAFRKLAGPTFIVATLKQILIVCLGELYLGLGLQAFLADPSKLAALPESQQLAVLAKALAFFLLVIVNVVFIIIPAHVALKRVQASLLPEEDESIVPFDRTFNGRVVPEILGGTGHMSLRGAWKSFDWNGRVRLFKVYAKVGAMEMGLNMLLVFVVLGELRLILGDVVDKIVFAAATGKNVTNL